MMLLHMYYGITELVHGRLSVNVILLDYTVQA